MGWKIRFYSGLNQGAEVPLSAGRVVIGSDPLSADLVLVDDGIAAMHLLLEVDPQGVRLLEWDAACEPTQDGLPVQPGTVLHALAMQQCGPLSWAYCAQERAFAPLQPAIGRAQERRAPRHPAHWSGRVMAGLSVVLVVLLIGLMSDPWSSVNRSTADEDPLLGLQTFLSDKPYQHVQIEAPQADGGVLLTGYLDDNRSRLLLTQYLEKSGLSYRLELRSMEEVRQGVDFILQKFGYSRVRSTPSSKAGWIMLEGELAEQDDHWANIDTLLMADVPGLMGVENRVRLAGSHIKRLEQLLSDAHLTSALSYRDHSERIELRGQLDERQLNDFAQLQRTFRREFGASPTLELINRSRRGSAEELAFVVRGVSLGKVPYVVLNDSQKYPVNASTPNGVRVLSITDEAIVVSRGKQQFIIHLKGQTQ
ncbi:type III secretion system inner membrane ring subunit SctD [Pseudomonas lundensis]|uniref:type III secretion system inner membrane ring subunit SctD n=1 Tax=Pseudomonas lundensis TaxID=86185 RepID=UPI000BA20C97|nr:type III secretion system inner membrane ring subunit SctD [Pseudomonas lundensis]OZY53021.1 EscD/YscD/HrpQ family type III secretion system inner membrane ring protein [Pseudomonas lundensis]